MELCCKFLGLSDVALLGSMMCYLLTTHHILRCQILRNVFVHSRQQATFPKLTDLLVANKPWRFGDVCAVELPRVLDTQGLAAAIGFERCYSG